jgi:Mg2+-importing ATPase
VLHDPPREGIVETIERLRELGVALKIVTGDNRIVAASIAAQVGLDGQSVLTGGELRELSDEALMQRAGETNVFAEIEPTV